MAAGRVATGFSKPYVAKYNNNGGTITYTDAQRLARGVSVKLNPESSEDNKFYADNQLAESAEGVFTGGTVDLEVDGLFSAAYNFIMGTKDASIDVDGWISDDNTAEVPNVAIGFVVRWMSDGVTSYQPIILTKTKFVIPEEERATQEDEIDWQTTTLTANLMRDDSTNGAWRKRGADFNTETLAENALLTKLGGNPSI